MPLYAYQCPKGHAGEIFMAMAERHPDWLRCVCGWPAHRVWTKPQVAPDVAEHFNTTTGCVIRSRRHLIDLQKRNGWQDYEKNSKSQSSDWRDRPDRAAQVRRQGAMLGDERSKTVFKDDPDVSVLEPE